MDQNKIGKFISKLRKEKNMTQKELAEKLNVTDRAISNWENGRRIPDVSFFKPLCEILNITINELLSGERIPEKKIKKTSEELLINSLTKTKKVKKKSNKIIICLIIISILLIAEMIIILKEGNKKLYPKIDIYSITVNASNPDIEYELKKEVFNNQNIYYYGIDSTQICNSEEYCYNLKNALINNQTDILSIKKYLESQTRLGNINNYKLWDGGTTIYNNKFLTIMFCNTTEGNKDIYIGLSTMVKDLNGAYCGREEYKTKSYTRTYQVTKAIINKEDSEFIDITLKQNNETGTVTINKSNNVTVGHIYEFTFYTFDYFEDTIENIFKYSTLLEVKETDKLSHEFINEKIYVNKDIGDDVELNELDHVSMSIKKGTLTATGATIIIHDLSGRKYVYGSPFTIEKKVSGNWVEVKNICDNCAFNAMAYGVDQDNILELNCNWERMYGKLKKGYYRIVKAAFIKSERPITTEDIKYFSVEFEIE